VELDHASGVEKGLLSAKKNGLLAGFPVIDFKATLVDGRYHDIDSSAPAFEFAARAAFGELRAKGRPILVEPIMRIEVTTPGNFVGDIVGDLNARRGVIHGRGLRGDTPIIFAEVPLTGMFGYGDELRSMTEGSGVFDMVYDHYEPVPRGWPGGPPDDVFPPAMGMRAKRQLERGWPWTYRRRDAQ
jgi:elongation factor G